MIEVLAKHLIDGGVNVAYDGTWIGCMGCDWRTARVPAYADAIPLYAAHLAGALADAGLVSRVPLATGWTAVREGGEIIPVDPSGTAFVIAFDDECPASEIEWEIERAQRSVDARRAVLALRAGEAAASVSEAIDDERVERAAQAMRRDPADEGFPWEHLGIHARCEYRDRARAVLAAADSASRAEGVAP